MIYITSRQTKKPYQLNFEDILTGKVPLNLNMADKEETGTITRVYETVPPALLEKVNIQGMINKLKSFNEFVDDLRKVDRKSLYKHYEIPKRSGNGMRPIDEPCKQLQDALGWLANFLMEECGVLYHTCAAAYMKGRCTKDAAEKHARFGSNWFFKTDLSGFFPSTTLEFTMKMLSMIFPLSEIMKSSEGELELRKAVELGFLNGGLPQGTKLSPFLTNAIFIPIDHALNSKLSPRAFVYTRYADDMFVSAKENFNYKKVIEVLKETFREFDAPYEIKPEKTKYGNVRGANWILGLMVNADHSVTVGYKNKKMFKAEMNNFIMDTLHNKPWDIGAVQHLEGLRSYYRGIEPEYFEHVVETFNKKYHVDTVKMLQQYLRLS